MTRSIKSLSAASILILGACAAVACSSGASAPVQSGTGAGVPGDSPGSATGSISALLALHGGITLNAVTYTITGANGFTASGTVDLSSASALGFTVGGLPAGTGYTIALTGIATDGTTSCLGSSTFSVVAQATSQVAVHLECHQPSTTGSAGVTANDNVCPVIDGVSASPNEVLVGSSLALSSTAHDVDNGPSPLTYSWTATSGAFSSATAQNPHFTCATAGVATLTLTVSDGDTSAGCPATLAVTVTCDASDGGPSSDAGVDATTAPDASDAGAKPPQALFTTLGAGAAPVEVRINQGTAIGQGSGNGATPFTLTNLAADPNNTQTIATNAAGAFLATGTVPDTAAGFCSYPADGGAPTRDLVRDRREVRDSGGRRRTGHRSAGAHGAVLLPARLQHDEHDDGQRVRRPAADHRPLRLAPEGHRRGARRRRVRRQRQTWYFMQTVLELNPDYTNPISGGYSATSTNTGCPATINGTNANFASAQRLAGRRRLGPRHGHPAPGRRQREDGAVPLHARPQHEQHPGPRTSRSSTTLRSTSSTSAGSSNKFPIWNTNNTAPGANDIKSISSALAQHARTPAPTPSSCRTPSGLLNPDGIMAVFPTPRPTPAGSPVTVLYVQKILNGDDTGATALPAAQQCNGGAVQRQDEPRHLERAPRDDDRRRQLHRPRASSRA